jgi:hypothetical protein
VPQPTAAPGTINGDAVDRFTLAHAAVGGFYGLTGLGWGPVVVLAIGWELLERPLKDAVPQMFPHASQDSATNALIDAAAVIGGWWVVRRIRGG